MFVESIAKNILYWLSMFSWMASTLLSGFFIQWSNQICDIIVWNRNKFQIYQRKIVRGKAEKNFSGLHLFS